MYYLEGACREKAVVKALSNIFNAHLKCCGRTTNEFRKQLCVAQRDVYLVFFPALIKSLCSLELILIETTAKFACFFSV